MYFHGKKKLFQITPGIFCTAQQLYSRMFSRCLCFYETDKNKVVNWTRQYSKCKNKGCRAAWKNININQPTSKINLFSLRGQQRCILIAFPKNCYFSQQVGTYNLSCFLYCQQAIVCILRNRYSFHLGIQEVRSTRSKPR